MPRRISYEAEECVLRSYFAGATRDETASECAVGGGTVTKMWGELEAKIGPEGRAVRDLRIQIKKRNLTVAEATQGANTYSQLEKLGINAPAVEVFAKDIYESSSRKGKSPEAIVDSASRLLEVEKESGLTFEQIVKKAEDKARDLKAAQELLEKTKTQILDAKNGVQRMLREKSITIERLDSYIQAREGLKTFRLNVDQDLSKTMKVLANLREQGYDVMKLVSETESHRSLTDENKELTKQINEQKREISQLQDTRKNLDEEITEGRDIMTELDLMKKISFTPDRIKALREKIVEISSAKGIEPDEAVENFFEDLKQYDAKIGLQNELQRLNAQVDMKRLELDSSRVEQDNLEKKIGAKTEALNAVQSLAKKGVETDHIVALDKISKKANVEPQKLLSELEGFAGIIASSAAKKKELEELRIKIQETEAALKAMMENKSRVENSITAIKDAVVQKIEEVSNQVQSLVNAATEAGRKLGGLEAIPPLIDLIIKMKGNPKEINTTLLFILQRYRHWLDEQEPTYFIVKGKVEELITCIPKR